MNILNIVGNSNVEQKQSEEEPSPTSIRQNNTNNFNNSNNASNLNNTINTDSGKFINSPSKLNTEINQNNLNSPNNPNILSNSSDHIPSYQQGFHPVSQMPTVWLEKGKNVYNPYMPPQSMANAPSTLNTYFVHQLERNVRIEPNGQPPIGYNHGFYIAPNALPSLLPNLQPSLQSNALYNTSTNMPLNASIVSPTATSTTASTAVPIDPSANSPNHHVSIKESFALPDSNAQNNKKGNSQMLHNLKPSPTQSRSTHYLPKPKENIKPHVFKFEKESVLRQEYAEKYAKLTVGPHNVNEKNIADGYVEFMFHHDPLSMKKSKDFKNAKQRIIAVPKSIVHEFNYTLWELYTFVQRLQNGVYRNWSELVGKLGMKNINVRAQYAQRIKRWMHSYKIDCYLNYLMGNEYDFHNPSSEKNKSVLSVIPAMKRKGRTRSDNYGYNKNNNEDEEEDGEGDEEGDGDEDEKEDSTRTKKANNDNHRVQEFKKRPMILPPGSRKRLKYSNDPEKLRQAAENFIDRRKHSISEPSEDEDFSDHKNESKDEEETDKENEQEDLEGIFETGFKHEFDAAGNMRQRVQDAEKYSINDPVMFTAEDKSKAVLPISPERDREEEDDEDELDDELNSVGPGSPVIVYAKHPNKEENIPSKLCGKCNVLDDEISFLKKEILGLKSYIIKVEDNLKRQKEATETGQQYINQLLLEKHKLRASYAKWRRRLAKDILEGPTIPKEDEDED